MNRTAPTKTHGQMVEEWKHAPEFKAVYDELEAEFTHLRELLFARQWSEFNSESLTQAKLLTGFAIRL